jgi:predicted nuclease with TOPRIM domain
MPDSARVSSLEAIETFRSSLIIYREKAGRILDEVNDSVVRTRLWLQTNRIAHWQNEVRQRDRELKEKLQELFSAQMSGLRNAPFAQQQAVRKAKEALREAEARLQTVRQWNRQFDQHVEPLAHQVEKFRHDLGHDLGKAVAWLMELSKTLSAYAELSQTTAASSPAPVSSEKPADAPASAGGNGKS